MLSILRKLEKKRQCREIERFAFSSRVDILFGLKKQMSRKKLFEGWAPLWNLIVVNFESFLEEFSADSDVVFTQLMTLSWIAAVDEKDLLPLNLASVCFADIFASTKDFRHIFVCRLSVS